MLCWADPPRSLASIQITHSDDGGRTWSAPRAVTSTPSRREFPFGAAIATATDGAVYVAWAALSGDVLVARSRDGRRFGRPRLVSPRPRRLGRS